VTGRAAGFFVRAGWCSRGQRQTSVQREGPSSETLAAAVELCARAVSVGEREAAARLLCTRDVCSAWWAAAEWWAGC
jgi:hypothetical protein